MSSLTAWVEQLREETQRSREEHTKAADRMQAVDTRLALLEQRFADWKKAAEESEQKRRQVLLLFLGCVLTFVVNILLLVIRR